MGFHVHLKFCACELLRNKIQKLLPGLYVHLTLCKCDLRRTKKIINKKYSFCQDFMPLLHCVKVNKNEMSCVREEVHTQKPKIGRRNP